jgi:hypothetical protein
MISSGSSILVAHFMIVAHSHKNFTIITISRDGGA